MQFETWPVKHLDVAMTVADHSGVLQFQCGFGDARSAHANILAISSCVIFNSFDDQAIATQQLPPTQLLVDR